MNLKSLDLTLPVLAKELLRTAILLPYVLGAAYGRPAMAQIDVATTNIAPKTAAPGQELTYRVGVSSVGDVWAGNVSIMDALPLHTKFVSAQQTSGEPASISSPPAGTNGTVKISLPALANELTGELCAIGSTVYFAANGDNAGMELWKSDGTTAGTVRVRDINPGPVGSSPRYLTNLNGILFFTAMDEKAGWELWKSNGTAAGTERVKDIYPGIEGSYPFDLTVFKGQLYFDCNDGSSGSELWKSDGTATGTFRVKDINPGANTAFPNAFTVAGETLFFSAFRPDTGQELWKSDGTEAGTVLVKDIHPSIGPAGYGFTEPSSLTDVNGTLFFSADNGIRGRELWKSDGTAAGTVLVRNIAPKEAGANPTYLTNVNGTLFFTADNGSVGQELWKSDGTTSGTVLVKDIRPAADLLGPQQLTPIGSTLYFAAYSLGSNQELWKSDGTSKGTVRVQGNNPALYNPYYLFNNNGTLYFEATNTDANYELWKSDGSAPGTSLIKEINPGATGSYPGPFVNASGTLYFFARDSANGSRLWKSDGTPAGTVPVSRGFIPRATFEITVKIEDGFYGTLSNTVTASTPNDSNLSNNTATAVTEVPDLTQPAVEILYPAQNAVLSDLSGGISGKVTDGRGITDVTEVYLHLSRVRNDVIEYWDPARKSWITTDGPKIATASKRPSTAVKWRADDALPTGAQLTDGFYLIAAVARDASGNFGEASSGFTINNDAAQVAAPAASAVKLSSTRATAGGTISLGFTTPLAGSAAQTSNYAVTSEADILEVRSVRIVGGSGIELTVPPVAVGSRLTIAYRLTDTSGAQFGGTANVTMR